MVKALFISCPKGLEELLVKELGDLGAGSVKSRVAGVECGGDLALAYRICLWSRLANRVLLPLIRFPVNSADDLYAGVAGVDWAQHFGVDASIAVDFHGVGAGINNTRFGAQRVKDGIVDVFRARTGGRPSVDIQAPDIRINAHLAKGQLTLSLDLAGESLHRRGYRTHLVAAPLKENLAVALLLRAGWPAIAAAGGALVDPLCGGGTLLIEAAMIAVDIAPGLSRQRFGFTAWRQHQPALWAALVAEAEARKVAGLARGLPPLFGADADERAIQAAADNIDQAGLEAFIHLECQSVADCRNPLVLATGGTEFSGASPTVTGLVITNPPYGERLGEVEDLRGLYQVLGDTLKREFPGWHVAVFTGNEALGFELGLRSHRRYQLFNGAIPAQLLLFDIRTQAEAVAQQRERKVQALSPGAEMLANRLRKNQRKLAAWLKRDGVQCYRLYDADLPEYAVAIDYYGDAVHVQEYTPPDSIDTTTAIRRMVDVRAAVNAVLTPAKEELYCKERRRQRRESQYQRMDGGGRGIFEVAEGGARFEVNLADYLDTGLFLDHRPVRRLIAGLVSGKRFLNLFCYTATATVQAILGGAVESLSVDMSNVYLAWAERNIRLNGLDPSAHLLLRADCLEWLASAAGEARYDVILLDPPTFSNSKKMIALLDVQRDHPVLITQAMSLLADGGSLIFSTNFRRFDMDPVVAERYAVKDISARTLDPDFARDPRIHRCWIITHKTATAS
ncbi:MAG: bifunctional 23S rRNA (guanine(2069)-N(7))-methyltransferase RlmK/23S rRNA (guanine(2445)-N(2))-methyltransferase RlmL [Porticoccaceae bacterium]